MGNRDLDVVRRRGAKKARGDVVLASLCLTFFFFSAAGLSVCFVFGLVLFWFGAVRCGLVRSFLSALKGRGRGGGNRQVLLVGKERER